jgi:hypothetical protein
MHRVAKVLSVGLGLFAALFVSGASHAEEPAVAGMPHRVGLAPSAQFVLDFDNDNEKDASAVGLSLFYAYRVAPNVELGAEARYLRVLARAPDVVLPSLVLRLFTPMGANDNLEFGTSVRLGTSHQTFHDSDGMGHSRHAAGAALSLAPDLRVHLSNAFALQLAAEGTVGTTIHAALQDEWESPYGTFVAGGLSAGVVTKF